jgi:hypothetical protein
MWGDGMKQWKQLRENERQSLSPKDFELRWGLTTEVKVSKKKKKKIKDPPPRQEKDFCKKRPARILQS